MGLGFINGKSEVVVETIYAEPLHQPRTTKPPTDVWVVLRGVLGIIATMVLLGGLVWGGAMLMASTASDEDVDMVNSRIERVEKNDIRQTVILEQIREALDKIEEKLDKVLVK